MKILTAVRTPDFISIIMYESIYVYIRTAEGLRNLECQYGPSATAIRDSVISVTVCGNSVTSRKCCCSRRQLLRMRK
jgi:hypothetical protein